jgi:hypothetical protein
MSEVWNRTPRRAFDAPLELIVPRTESGSSPHVGTIGAEPVAR